MEHIFPLEQNYLKKSALREGGKKKKKSDRKFTNGFTPVTDCER